MINTNDGVAAPHLARRGPRRPTQLKSTALFLALLATQARAQHGYDLATVLLQKDKALLMAVHRGDRATWARLTTADFAYIEEGAIQQRAAFLRDIREDGLQPLIIEAHDVRRIGDTAIVVHHDRIPSHGAGSRPVGRYLMTETWQRIEHAWKLRLIHVEAIRSDPPAVRLSTARLDEFAGTYRAGAETIIIKRDGTRIVGIQAAGPELELLAEARDVLFRPGETRVRWVFQRDPVSEDITGVVVRDENSDVPYVRVR